MQARALRLLIKMIFHQDILNNKKARILRYQSVFAPIRAHFHASHTPRISTPNATSAYPLPFNIFPASDYPLSDPGKPLVHHPPGVGAPSCASATHAQPPAARLLSTINGDQPQSPSSPPRPPSSYNDATRH